MSTPKGANSPEPKHGTKAYYQQQAEELQAQLERLKDVEGSQLIGLNVTIKKRTRDAARTLAQQRGITLRALTEEALEQYLDREQDNG